MALSIKDIFAASYNAVSTKKAANQWAESAVLREMDRQGFIKRVPLGDVIQEPLDYQVNASAGFLSTDIDAVSLSKTSVLGAAQYDIANLGVSIVWTKADEARNPTTNQKIDYVESLITNGISSHDHVIETGLFAASATNSFESFRTMMTNAGTGTIGGIVSGTDTMWKSQFKDYDLGAALLADLQTVFNACAKGSGSPIQPTLIATSSTGHGLYVGKLVANQRFVDSGSMNGSAKNILFLDAPVVFSHKATTDDFYFLNPKSLQLKVSSTYFRAKGEVKELDTAYAYGVQIFSSLALVTNNRSRLGVCFT